MKGDTAISSACCFLPDLTDFADNQLIAFHTLCADSLHNFMVEREGFEPSIPVSQNTRFPIVRLRPLSHLSVSAT